jgi:hypothetical protein
MRRFGYCVLCKRNVTSKRHFTFGTFIAVLVTGGLWIFILPFYRKGCQFCGNNRLTNPKEDKEGKEGETTK